MQPQRLAYCLCLLLFIYLLSGCEANHLATSMAPTIQGEISLDANSRDEIERKIVILRDEFKFIEWRSEAVSVGQKREAIFITLRDPKIRTNIVCFVLTDMKNNGMLEFQIYKEGFSSEMTFNAFVKQAVPLLEAEKMGLNMNNDPLE